MAGVAYGLTDKESCRQEDPCISCVGRRHGLRFARGWLRQLIAGAVLVCILLRGVGEGIRRLPGYRCWRVRDVDAFDGSRSGVGGGHGELRARWTVSLNGSEERTAEVSCLL